MSIVYDVGMHNGDDSAYYLKKGHQVVAIEANPFLCAAAQQRFATEIATGQLIVLNVAIADRHGEAAFYIDVEKSVKSSLVPPADMAGHEKVTVRTAPLASLIPRGAEIAFLKIDIEHVDGLALDSLKEAGIVPPLLSAEAHSFDVIEKVCTLGYGRFRLVNCRLVRKQNKRRRIRLLDGSTIVYPFPSHSSGPYGEDLPGPWLSFEDVADTYARRRELLDRGWYDVHASL